MAIRTWLTGTVGVRHLWTLDNEGTSTAHDLGDSVAPSNIKSGNYSFVTAPVCYGVDYCLRSTTGTNTSTDGALFNNKQDINNDTEGADTSTYDWDDGTKQIFFWARQKEIWNATCLCEEGAQINNLAFIGGARVTFQAADSGQPFLIIPSKTLSVKDRAILHWAGWEYQADGGSNKIWYTENGIVQGQLSAGGTEVFPVHAGELSIGNTSDTLKTFNEDVLLTQTVASDCNFLGLRNNEAAIGTLAEGDEFALAREFFERCVIGEVVIAADTVANQQIALDALSGNIYQNVNCAIEIRQATDATDYTLTLDNIKFIKNDALKDIAVKYVGPNTLTLINDNGSNAEVIAVPAEQDLDGTTILTGGGSIVIVDVVDVTITCLDIQGNPIENVRVFVKTASTNVIDKVLTNASGVATAKFNYTSDIALVGSRARKGSSSPYYKTAQISGTITANGFNTTVTMLNDE